jgi:hypothetical protein
VSERRWDGTWVIYPKAHTVADKIDSEFFLRLVRERGETGGIDGTDFDAMTDAVVLDIDTALPVPPFPHVTRPTSLMQLFKRDRAFLDVPVMLKPRFVVAAEHRVHFELSFSLASWFIGDNRLPVPWVVAVVETQQDVRIRALLEMRKIIVKNEIVQWCVGQTSLLGVVPDVVVFNGRLHLPSTAYLPGPQFSGISTTVDSIPP